MTTARSNRTDIGYLMYVPFCQVFVSSDKLHRSCAPHFLRPDQTFVWGPDLKADLKHLVAYYEALPETEKEEDLAYIAPTPPVDTDGLVGRLWDRYLRSWRDRPKTGGSVPEGLKSALEELIRMIAVTGSSDAQASDVPALDFVQMTHRPRIRRFGWRQAP
jgi:hypothetical protein